jgi:hypothetical protein
MDEPLREGEDYYLENGLLVFTRGYLLRRGFCCKSGCRHCPYNEDSSAKGREEVKAGEKAQETTRGAEPVTGDQLDLVVQPP